jgi:hypothetical protein
MLAFPAQSKLRSDRGAGQTEYVIVVILIALVVLVSVRIYRTFLGTRTYCAGEKVGQLGDPSAPTLLCGDTVAGRAGALAPGTDEAARVASIDSCVANLDCFRTLSKLLSEPLPSPATADEIRAHFDAIQGQQNLCNQLSLQCGGR